MKNIAIRKLGITLLSSILLLGNSAANAGDDKVNCRNEVIENQTIYSGDAQCFVEFTNSWGQTEIALLYAGFINASLSPTYHIEQFYPGYDGRLHALECDAELIYTRIEPIYGEVCEYTPNVTLSTYQDSIYSTSIYATGTDRDGSIVGYTWWVDGVRVSGSGNNITINRRGPAEGSHRTVKVDTVDNDGHTDTKTITATFKSPSQCTGRRC